MYEVQITQVTFKLCRFVLANMANLSDQLEAIAKSVWGNFSPYAKIMITWFPTGIIDFVRENLQNNSICDYTES